MKRRGNHDQAYHFVQIVVCSDVKTFGSGSAYSAGSAASSGDSITELPQRSKQTKKKTVAKSGTTAPKEIEKKSRNPSASTAKAGRPSPAAAKAVRTDKVCHWIAQNLLLTT